MHAIASLLTIPDLTLAATATASTPSPDHAVRLLVDRLEGGLRDRLHVPVVRKSLSPVVLVQDNYDRLLYPPDAITRDRRYTHYVDQTHMLRSHTSAHIPALLTELASTGAPEQILTVPGMCYRRDVIDRTHVGTPHQVDLWWVRPGGRALREEDLMDLIDAVVTALLPGSTWSAPPSSHPYTQQGHEIYVRTADGDLEIGECGLAHPNLLRAAGLPAAATGLAMGLGLDRLVMLTKGIDDIRLLRSAAPRVASQMGDLDAYRPVSKAPAARRDISIALVDPVDPELLGDQVREALGDLADQVEEVEVLSHTPYEALPISARERMGVTSGMSNVLLRLRMSHSDRTMTSDEANVLRDEIYRTLHRGARSEWTTPQGA